MVVLAALVATCRDQGPMGPDIGLAHAGFDLTGLARAGGNLPIPVDSLRVILRRIRDNSVAVDTAIGINSSAVRSNQDTIALSLKITLKESPEAFLFQVQAVGGGVVYYEVSGNISVEANGITRTPELAPTYVGPGAVADSVTMTLTPSAIAGGDSALAWARVWDGDTVVSGVPVGFSSSDTLKLNRVRYVGVDSAWIYAPLTLNDSVDIIALTPTHLTQSQRLRFAPRPTQLVKVSGDAQSVPAGTAAASPLVVELRDAAGNPYPYSHEIVFAVVSGPTGTMVAPLQDTTDAAGLAQTSLTAGGTSGAVQISATATGIAGAAVTFSATVTGGGGPGAPDTVVIISGNNQTALNGTQLPAPLVVEVRDQAGIPVPGVTVDWAAVQGSAAPTTGPTNASGRAQTNWTLGTNTAGQTLVATVLGLTPQTFNATATFASPTILLSFSGIPGVGIGLSTNLTVGLSAPAGPGGVNVTVSSDAPGIVTIGGTGHVVIPQNQSSGTIQINGVGLGTTTVRGNATGFTEGTLTVDVQNRNIAVPPTLNVAYGQTASLPIQLPAPAPAGGVTFAVSTSDASIVDVLTPSVTIPAGGQTANATLSGVLPGPATISVTNPAYITGTSVVTTAAALNIVQAAATLNSSFPVQIDIDFTSNGQGIAAPAPGVAITAVIANPACVAATPVTIPTGVVSSPMTLSYGGTATLPCSTQLKVTAPNIQPDSINVTVNPQPGISVNPATVGSGLQVASSGNLAASNHGGVTVTLTSGDPNVLLAPNATTVGTGTLNIFVPNNQTGFSYVVQGLEGQTGTTPVTLTATAPGFISGNATVDLVEGAIDLIGVPTNTTTLSAISSIFSRTGIPNSQTTPAFMAQFQVVRFGAPAPLTVTFADDDPGNASTLVAQGAVLGDTLSALIVAGAVNSPTDTSSGGVALKPQVAGTSTVSASIPGFLQLPSAVSSSVTITQPGITMNAATVGSGLQVASSGFLGATSHGGVTVTLTSGNPNVLLAPNGSTVGTTTLNIFVPNNQNGFNYVVQGLEGQTGTTPVTISVTAPGFSNGSGTVDLVEGAIDLIGLPANTTTLSPISSLASRTGIPNSQTSPAFMSQFQVVRFGAPAPLTVTFANDDPGNASTLVAQGPVLGDTLTAQIVAGAVSTPNDTTSGGVALKPQVAGTSTVSAFTPGFLQLPSAVSSSVTITQPGISVNPGTVGSGLQVASSGFLGATNHGGVTVTLTSGNPNVLLAPDASTVGTGTLNIFVPNNQNGFNYVLQGLEGHTGTTPVTVTATAPGFSNGSATVDLVEGAIDLIGLPATTTTLSSINNISSRTGIPNSQTAPSFMSQFQVVRFGAPGPLTVTFASQTPSVGNLLKAGPSFAATQTAVILAGQVSTPGDTTSGGVAFHPILAGSTVVSASIPGFLQLPSAAGSTVAISQPGITMNPATVGMGLQTAGNGSLGAPNHGGVTVTLTSSNSALLLSPNASTAGASSITVPVANGQTSFSYFVQGLEGLPDTVTVAVTAVASGFTQGNGTADVVIPAFDVVGFPFNPAAGATPSPLTARVGVANGTYAFMTQFQAVRAGAPGPLTVTLTSNAPAVGTLEVTAGTGATQTVQIQPQSLASPNSVATGGVALQPLSPGNVTVTTTIPGFIGIPSAVTTITVH